MRERSPCLDNSKIPKGREVVKLDFTISHKLSARVSRKAVRRKASARKGKRERKRNIQREREERKTGNINNPIHEASDVTHVFILAEFDSSREDYISWDCVSGEQTQS